jgi:hypothetical protein
MFPSCKNVYKKPLWRLFCFSALLKHFGFCGKMSLQSKLNELPDGMN